MALFAVLAFVFFAGSCAVSPDLEHILQKRIPRPVARHARHVFGNLNPKALINAQEYTNEAFRLGDADSDGRMSALEVQTYYSSVDETMEVKDVRWITKITLNYGDTNKDGFLTREEFVVSIKKLMYQKNELVWSRLNLRRLSADEFTSKAFEIGDRDGDQKLSFVEIKRFYLQYGIRIPPNEAAVMAKWTIKSGDADNDGFLVSKELLVAVKKYVIGAKTIPL